MPMKRAAFKSLRQSAKNAQRNLQVKENIRYLVKKTVKGITDKDSGKAKEWLGKSMKAIDRAAQNGILKKNTASRKKSRLMAQFNKVFLRKK